MYATRLGILSKKNVCVKITYYVELLPDGFLISGIPAIEIDYDYETLKMLLKKC